MSLEKLVCSRAIRLRTDRVLGSALIIEPCLQEVSIARSVFHDRQRAAMKVYVNVPLYDTGKSVRSFTLSRQQLPSSFSRESHRSPRFSLDATNSAVNRAETLNRRESLARRGRFANFPRFL